MEEDPDDALFDTSLKKKKKKTKKLVALEDEDLPGESSTDGPAAETASPLVVSPDADAGAGADDAEEEDDDFLGKKKKKKKAKKRAFDIDAAEAAEEDAAAAEADENEIDASAVVTVPLAELGDLASELSFPLKKKRKRAVKVPEEFAENSMDRLLEQLEGAEAAKSQVKIVDTAAWAGSNRDYLYTELLERVFDIMRAKNPNMAQGEKRRFVMKPPSVIRVGSRKSGFINFVEICKMMHRQPDHVLGFLLTELGTSGTLDGSNSLILKGRFQQKQMESVLRRYIREYVTCHTCKSPDTILSKENRLFFLTCEQCGARNSVSSIKAGFSAVVGKRSRLRAKEG